MLVIFVIIYITIIFAIFLIFFYFFIQKNTFHFITGDSSIIFCINIPTIFFIESQSTFWTNPIFEIFIFKYLETFITNYNFFSLSETFQ